METTNDSLPEQLSSSLANIKAYLLLVLRKGENYDQPDTKRIIQSEHLPYLFKLREEGIVDISMPIISDGALAAIAVINATDKKAVQPIFEQDPAVKAGIFTFELLSAMGLRGDLLR